MLLYDQCANMAAVNVDKTAVLDLFRQVHDGAKALPVQKEASRKLQDQILANYNTYRETIERTYINAEGRA